MRDRNTRLGSRSRDAAARVAGGVLLAAAVALIVVLLANQNGNQPAPGPAPTPRPAPTPLAPGTADLTVRPGAAMAAIPRSFLGLSTEYWTLPVDERHIALYKAMLANLHVPGDGPFVLRIGGDSSDHTFFDPRLVKFPRWAFELTPAFVDQTASVVRQMNLRVILDLNLVTGTPVLAAAWAHYAETQMPRGSIIGLEVGNEPDLYDRAFWMFAANGERFTGRTLPPDITAQTYAQTYLAFARQLTKAAPDVPLLAPALANPGADISWISTLLASPHPGLGEITGHRYPYSACALPGSPVYPTIDRLLSEQATVGMADSVRPAVQLAHHAGLPFRLTEFNSITCGGLTGISNTFATSLWAPDAAFELFKAGANGINLHARVFAINDPFTFDGPGLHARPLLYGLILFARTLGPHSRLVTSQLRTGSSIRLKAWVVRVGKDTLHVLLINKGAAAASTQLRLPATGPATVQRLLAPSPASHGGAVSLGGQQLNSDGKWQGTPVRQSVLPVGRRYSVVLPGYSAALLTVRVAPRSLQ
jgi:hypothetical protein